MFRPAFLSFLLFAILGVSTHALAQAPIYPCRVVNEYPHNPDSYTQGLFIHEGVMYESSGGFGNSYLAKIDMKSGRTLKYYPVEGKYFAEGITPYKGKLYMLTWLSGSGFIHSLEDLKELDVFPYRETNEAIEGWGLAFDGKRFIMSTGKAHIRFHNPSDFYFLGSRLIRDDGEPVRLLNELEYVGGMLLANVWKKDRIAVIDIESGEVAAWIDLSPLREQISKKAEVANGIAYDHENGKLYVTGKHWDKLFEIEIDAVLWRQLVNE